MVLGIAPVLWQLARYSDLLNSQPVSQSVSQSVTGGGTSKQSRQVTYFSAVRVANASGMGPDEKGFTESSNSLHSSNSRVEQVYASATLDADNCKLTTAAAFVR